MPVRVEVGVRTWTPKRAEPEHENLRGLWFAPAVLANPRSPTMVNFSRKTRTQWHAFFWACLTEKAYRFTSEFPQ